MVEREREKAKKRETKSLELITPHKEIITTTHKNCGLPYDGGGDDDSWSMRLDTSPCALLNIPIILPPTSPNNPS